MENDDRPNLPKPNRGKRKRYQRERLPDPNAVGTNWRLFVAVPLPSSVIALVGALVRDFATEDWPVRWVAPETAHITLQFIGEVPPERAELLRMALPPVVAKHAAFRLRTADLGVFPNQRRPRVIWLGLYGPAHRLQTLHADVVGTLRRFDVAAEESEFHPHITLGRVRDVRDRPTRDLPAAIQRRFADEAASGRVSSKNPLPVPIDEVVLYRSILSHQRPRYEPLVRCPLGPPERR
jgi:2'-5' RNA ligase